MVVAEEPTVLPSVIGTEVSVDAVTMEVVLVAC